jgi:ribonuclease P protein component
MNFTYPKRKLKSKISIGLFTEGKSVSKYPLRLVYHFYTDNDGEKIKWAFALKKQKSSRSYFKRVLR